MLKQFKFVEVIEPETKSSVLSKMLKDFDTSYHQSIKDMILKSEPHYILGLLLRYCPYEEKGDKVVFKFVDGTLSYGIADLDMFCFFFKDGNSLGNNLNFLVENCEYYEGNSYLNSKEIVDKNENGQSKIAISSLLNLIDSGPTIHLLVIGSYAEAEAYKSGKTYEALIDFFVESGYNGSMVLYDPYEISRALNYDTSSGTFHVDFIASKYDYNKKLEAYDGSEFTHILDDAWIPTITKIPVKINLSYKVKINLVEGSSKFAYTVDDKNKVVEIVNGLNNHSDLLNAVGGGLISKVGSYVRIFGSSTRVGHYDSVFIKHALGKHFSVVIDDNLKFGKYALDPDENLFKFYPQARISCKYFGEDFKVGGVVRDQFFYTGFEKRFYTHFPQVKYQYYGCGCSRCMEYGLIVDGLKIYNKNGDSRKVESLLNSIVTDPHIHLNRGLYVKVRNYIHTYAHAKRTLKELLKFCVERYHCSSEMVLRALSAEIRYKRISVDSADPRIFKNRSVTSEGILAYNDSNEYMVEIEGLLIPPDFNVILNYRPFNTKNDYIPVLTYFHERYIDLISYTPMLQKYGKGQSTLGVSPTDGLQIVKGKDGHIVDTYHGWSLKFNSISI